MEERLRRDGTTGFRPRSWRRKGRISSVRKCCRVSDDPLDALLAALKLSPDNLPLRQHVVQELLKSRRYRQAAEVAEPLLGSEHRALGLLARARQELAENRLDQARTSYREAITLNSKLIDEGLETELEVQQPLRVPLPGEGKGEREDTLEDDNRMRITFDQIGGMDSLKEKIRLSILYPLQKPEIYAAYGKKIGGGLLLYGPPGCGKTYLARATAGELGANFYTLSLNEILSMWLGESEKALARLFETARQHAPSVIFIDEVDALGAKRSDFNSATGRAIVSQFLVEMDGIVSNNQKVMVLGATNMPWNVDSALRRPGRFDRVLFVPPPDRPAREQILQIHCQNRRLSSAVNLAEMATKTEHFSGADLSHLVEMATERALSEALRSGQLREVDQRDFQMALKECRPSTMEWLRRAKNYVNFANQDGLYDDLDRYLEKARIR